MRINIRTREEKQMEIIEILTSYEDKLYGGLEYDSNLLDDIKLQITKEILDVTEPFSSKEYDLS